MSTENEKWMEAWADIFTFSDSDFACTFTLKKFIMRSQCSYTSVDYFSKLWINFQHEFLSLEVEVRLSWFE